MWWGVLLELAETKNNLSACNAKSKGGRAKNSNVALLTAVRQCGGVQPGGRGLNRLLNL